MRNFSFYAAKINKIRLTNRNFYDINIVIGCEGNNAGFERFQRERSAAPAAERPFMPQKTVIPSRSRFDEIYEYSEPFFRVKEFERRFSVKNRNQSGTASVDARLCVIQGRAFL